MLVVPINGESVVPGLVVGTGNGPVLSGHNLASSY